MRAYEIYSMRWSIEVFFSDSKRLLESLNLDNRSLGGLKRENCQLTNLQVFQILLLLPFFAIKGFSHYDGSVLCRMFGGKKDILYSYLSQDNVNLRNVVYRITNWLLTKVTVRQDHKKSLLPTVLIADDTDLPKTGMHMESIGKIFSHVFQRCILSYKLLALCWSDGRSQFVVDFSIHGERGKVDGKEQGLTARQRERRYNRKRDRDCQTEKRKEEYFVSKLERLKSMVKRPLEDCSPIYMKAYTSSPSWKRSGQSLLM